MKTDTHSDLYEDMLKYLTSISIIDTHEHLQRDYELPAPGKAHIGRFFLHYTSSDLVSAGMSVEDMERARGDASDLDPYERWRLIKPWYQRSWNTAYFESLRIALQDIYDIEDLSDETVGPLTDRMNQKLVPGITREIFDKAGIEFAMNNVFGPRLIFNDDQDPDVFLPDIVDNFTALSIADLSRESGMAIHCLEDYLRVIDSTINRYGHMAGGVKIPLAYTRSLYFEDVTQGDVERTFNRLMAFEDTPDQRDIKALQNYLIHYLCRVCGEVGVRIKLHCGLHEGNGNDIKNSRAALLSNLFMKYPKTGFDIYHISYPYQEEAVALVKNFQNVTTNFCWMWIINPTAGRRALSDMLDCVPFCKLHGFGGDYLFVEGSYAHAVMARREIAKVLTEKVASGRFSESMAREIGRCLLRDNALDNFGLEQRRAAYRTHYESGKEKAIG